jgi:hypothetical protein
MWVIQDFLNWLEEHQIGILTTIVVHLLIISVILILRISTFTGRDYSIMIDMSLINANMEEIIPDEISQPMKTVNQEYNVPNIPVNTADKNAIENIEKMVRDVKTELNITDKTPPKDNPAEITSHDDKSLENEARIYDDKYPINAAGERTIYKGQTTVSYELSGRRHTWMPAPVYKCRTGGTITVNIVVNGNGYVLTAEIDKIKSNSEDICIVEAAKRDAERSRFNVSSLAKQQGTITYIFQAQ